MYDIIELNGKKVAELREIATTLEINRVDKLKKQDLVYAILDEQALRPQNDSPKKKPSKAKANSTNKSSENTEERKGKRTRKRKGDEESNEPKSGGESMRERRDRRRKENESKEAKSSKPSQDSKDNSSDNSEKKDRKEGRRNDRGERGDRNDRGERGNRNDRNDRGDRNRNRNNRRDKHDRYLSEPEEHGYDFDNLVEVEGVLEVQPEGHGLLRSADYNYLNSPDDVYVTPKQMKQFSIQNGDTVVAGIRPPRKGEKFYPLISVKSVNGRSLEWIRDRVPFKYLTPLFPQEKFNLSSRRGNTSMRLMDLFSPIGKGQRGMLVSQPKTGKTTLLKDLANSIAINHPEVYLIILLIDERPEEVTDMKRSVNGEVIASTFDEPADRHVKIANLVLEKAKRMVECGHDVCILLDSITRLARAYNTVSPSSGKILSGGVEANALQKPKRFFGAARNIENGGSLSIIATALVDTGSKMDEVIFEEFKGTGNMELMLDRRISNRRIYPAIDILSSGTRREDLLMDKETLQRVWILRKHLADMNAVEAMEFVKGRLESTKSNEEFLNSMNG